jgi:hypothetical protein
MTTLRPSPGRSLPEHPSIFCGGSDWPQTDGTNRAPDADPVAIEPFRDENDGRNFSMLADWVTAAARREIEVVQSLAEGAFAIGNTGIASTHILKVVEAATSIADRVDVLYLAQVSMALGPAVVQDCVAVAVLTSSATAVVQLKELLGG